jgi:DegV family protein with EDD domain
VTISIVTDSNAQLPPELAERFGIEVVPLTVTVDGVAYLEGVDLDADDFYSRFERGGSPVVATSQPSPGRFADAYQRLADGGATEILSVHIGSSVSGTVNAARLAAGDAPVPVRVVDTGTASFAVALCAWASAEAIAAGATLDEAATAAARVSATVGNVFVVRALDLARAGGRLAPTMELGSDEIAVLTLTGGVMRTLGYARDLDGAAGAMAVHVRSSGTGLRVGVGVADAGTEPLAEALASRLQDAAEVSELVRYRIGPSVGAHTGPGTVGTMFVPIGS